MLMVRIFEDYKVKVSGWFQVFLYFYTEPSISVADLDPAFLGHPDPQTDPCKSTFIDI